MSRVARMLFILAVALVAVIIIVLAYVIVGGLVFGITTSSFDPEQGPSWPMHVVVWSFLGIIIAAPVGALLSWLSRNRDNRATPGS